MDLIVNCDVDTVVNREIITSNKNIIIKNARVRKSINPISFSEYFYRRFEGKPYYLRNINKMFYK